MDSSTGGLSEETNYRVAGLEAKNLVHWSAAVADQLSEAGASLIG